MCVCVCVCVCLQQSTQSSRVVSFCRYPYLLDPQAKSVLMHVESRVQMAVSPGRTCVQLALRNIHVHVMFKYVCIFSYHPVHCTCTRHMCRVKVEGIVDFRKVYHVLSLKYNTMYVNCIYMCIVHVQYRSPTSLHSRYKTRSPLARHSRATRKYIFSSE